MISSTLDRIAVQTNTSATETRVMGIHAEALAAVTDSMTNLYSNPHLAVLREYSTNAWDAIVAAGSTSPVRVSLPDDLDPRLVVSDDGIGMSKDEVLTFFSQYGASNKRDVNTQIGSFGFGCKAAFAIADQFVVTAVRDHYRTVALFARNSEGIGTASIMSHQPTEAANGVEVAVPVNDTGAMCAAATKFFAAWEPGTVEVDGEEWRSLSTVGVRIGAVRLLDRKEAEEFGSSNYRTHVQTHVVMGNVSYPVASSDADGCWSDSLMAYAHTYIYAGIGDVDIVPSREGLRNTDRTKAFLRAARQRFDTESVRYVEAAIAACPTWYDAAAILHQHQIVPCVRAARNTFTWRGHRLDVHTSLDVPVLRLDANKGRIAKPADGDSIIGVSAKNILAITGVTPDTEHSVRLGLRALCVQEGFGAVVLCARADYTHEWFTLANPGVTVMTLAESKAARKAALKVNASPRASSGPLTYRVVARGCTTEDMSLAELRALPALAYTDADSRQVRDSLLAVECDTPVVVLTARQSEDVFRRRCAAARPLTAVLDQAVAAIIAAFTPAGVAEMVAARRVSKFTSNDTRIARMLHPVLGSITNPEVAALVVACTTEAGSTAATERLRLLSGTPLVRMSAPWLAFEATLAAAAGGDERGFIARFPLLESVRYSFDSEKLPHVVAYLNAVTLPALKDGACSGTSGFVTGPVLQG